MPEEPVKRILIRKDTLGLSWMDVRSALQKLGDDIGSLNLTPTPETVFYQRATNAIDVYARTDKGYTKLGRGSNCWFDASSHQLLRWASEVPGTIVYADDPERCINGLKSALKFLGPAGQGELADMEFVLSEASLPQSKIQVRDGWRLEAVGWVETDNYVPPMD